MPDSNDWNYQQVEDFLQQLLVRSASDLDFRRQLLTDPQAAIEAHLGRPLNGSLDVRFIENTVDATIVLPDVELRALSDDELETVSGGSGNLGEGPLEEGNLTRLLTLLNELG